MTIFNRRRFVTAVGATLAAPSVLRAAAPLKLRCSLDTAPSHPRNVALVDAEKLLSDAESDGIIGSDQIYEHVHMTPQGNYLLARAMLAEIEPGLPSSVASASNKILSEADCERALALTDGHVGDARVGCVEA